jgi:GT2 family glycosyltransferase
MDPIPIDISVIIVSWNVCKLLDDCLYSVGNALDGLRAEAFVIDNASQDGSAQMVAKKYPWVSLIANPANLGYGRANNQALRICRGKYDLLLNPDTLVKHDAIQKMIDFMEAHPRAGLAAPEQVDTHGKIHFSDRCFYSPRLVGEYLVEWLVSIGQRTRIIYKAPRRVPQLNASCWIARPKAMTEVGLFDENLFLYFEGVDICHRMRQADWEVWFLPNITILHYGQQSTRQWSRLHRVQVYHQSMLTWLKKRWLKPEEA